MSDKLKMLNLISRLEYFNEWRRGGEGEQPSSKQIGKDIDAAVCIIHGFIDAMEDAGPCAK